MKYESGTVTIEEVTAPKQKDPIVTLKISAKLSDWEKVRSALGDATTGNKVSYPFWDMLDDALTLRSE